MSQRLRRERAASQQTSNWRLAGYIVVGVLGTVFIVAVVGLALILHTTTPPVIHIDAAAAQRLQNELKEAQTAADNGASGVVQADETELNSLLKEYLQPKANKLSPESAAVLRDMRMNLAGDRINLYLLANFRGEDITIVLEGKLRTVDGYLDFQPTRGKIGSLPIPKGSLKRAVEQMLATSDGREVARLPKNLRDLRVEDGKLVAVFR